MGELEANDVAVHHEELFNYLHTMLQQIEEQTGEPDVELREKIQSLITETTRTPSSVDPPVGDIQIAEELDKLSAKLDSLEEKIVLDSDVQNILSATADLWMPTITASSQDRISIASTSSNLTEKSEHKEKS